jgi:hypothetical protein
MAVDPNLYALNIELQLDSSKAFDVLGDFEISLMEIENKIKATAEGVISQIEAQAQSINVALQNAVVSVTALDNSSANMSLSMGKYSEFLQLSTDNTILQLDKLTESEELWDKVEKHHIEIQKSIEEEMENLTETEKIWEKIGEHHKDIEDAIAKEASDIQKYTQLVSQLDATIVSKNQKHKEENDLIKKEEGLWKNLHRAGEKQNNTLRQSTAELEKVAKNVLSIVKFYADAVKEADEFNNANFRLYGSQMDLYQSSRMLSAELGTNRQEAIQIYKALGNAKMPKAELDKLAKSIAITSTASGLSTQQLVKFVSTLRAAGYTAEEQQKRLAMLTQAMRQYGLSAEDAAKMTNYMAGQMVDLKLILGSKEEVDKFSASMANMYGIAKASGMEKGIEDFQERLKNPEAWAYLEQVYGDSIKNSEDFNKAVLATAQAFKEQQLAIESMPEGASRVQATMEFNAQAEAIYGSADAAKAQIKVYEEMELRAKELGKSVSELTDEDVKGMKAMQEAQNTLTAQFNKLYNTLMSVADIVWVQFIAEGLKDIIMVINMAIDAVQAFVSNAVLLAEKLGIAQYFTGEASIAFRIFRGILVALFVLVGSGITMMVAFGGAWRLLGRSSTAAGQSIASSMASMARSLTTMATAIGRSIFIVLSNIGKGLASLGKQVSPYIVQIILLSLAVLVLAAALYVTAQAMLIIKEAGWEAIGMLAVVIALMLLFTVALVAIGAVIQGPVAIGVLILAGLLLALGISVALVGAGIMMMGMGVKLVGEGILMMAEGLSVDLPVKIGALAVAIGGLAIASWASVASISAIGYAFYSMSKSITKSVAAMEPLLGLFEKLSGAGVDQSLQKIPEAFKKLQADLQTVDLSIFKTLAEQISQGSTILLRASIKLFLASIPFAVAGFIIAFGAKAMAFAINALDGSAKLLPGIAENLLVGAKKLMEALPIMLSVAIKLGVVAFALVIPSLVFAFVSGVLLIGSLLFFAASALISAGGAMFYAGTLMFQQGAEFLKAGCNSLVESASTIYSALKILLVVSIGLLVTGAALALAGLIFTFGSVLIFLAMITIVAAFNILLASASKYEKTLMSLGNLGSILSLLVNGISSFAGVSVTSIKELTTVTVALGKEVDKMAAVLDQYASAFESAAARISDAINNKVMPAMKAAKEAGVITTTRAETIVTTPIFNSGDTGPAEQTTAASDPAATISEAIGKTNNKQVFDEMLAVLKTYLPEMAEKDMRSLSNSLTGW